MSLTQTMISGTIQADGTLLLDEKPNMLSGRVTVVLRQAAEIDVPKDDPFWQRMQAIWDLQSAGGHFPRSADDTVAEQQEIRRGWAERQEGIEQLQAESRRQRRSAVGAKP